MVDAGGPGRKKRDRDAILARRKVFIASALAGLAASGCEKEPTVCLSVVPVREAGATQAAPCLEVERAPSPTASAATGEDEPSDLADPSVCLKIALPKADATPPLKPAPRPCLKVAPSKK